MEELKKKSSKQSSFRLQQTIEACLAKFRLDERHKNVSLHLIDDLVAPLSIKGEEQQLAKILDLIFLNAIAVINATKVNIYLKQLLTTQHEVLLEFTVEDNGIKDFIDSNEFAIAYKNNLQEIKKEIESCGGKTEISSLEGVGTTVKFLLKFLTEVPVELSRSTLGNKLADKRILIAEDNEINQKIIAHLLKKENIEADVANNGKEAVELFEKNKYDLVLLDLQMPYMDGFQTAKYIRKIIGSNVPIVAMTAGAFANEQIRCFEIGINQYLSKPFTADDLFQRLKYLLLNEHIIKPKKRSSALSSNALYNLNTLKLSNDEKEVIEILEMFVSKTPVLLEEIKEAMETEEASCIIKRIAKLKGSLGSLQMQTAMQIVDEIENYIRLDDIHKIPVAIEKLHAEYNIIAPLLIKELRQLQVNA